MRLVIFTHSLVSDWNNGNAHFLRGVASEFVARNHEIRIFEPADGWSRRNLLSEQGESVIEDFHRVYPGLQSTLYDEHSLDLDQALRGADAVIVHEWNPPSLVARIGQHRTTHGYRLFFHDTHHRSFSESDSFSECDLRHYDCVLAYGAVIRDAYVKHGWARRVVVWHEAADTNVFHPIPETELLGDLVWIGNWGDDERSESLREFLVEPVRKLGLKARVHGVRYPQEVISELQDAGIDYAGWLPNFRAPDAFAAHRVTVHVPRGPYVKALPGIPTIRPFEALACGIPLVSAPWSDSEHLFCPGKNFLFAGNGAEMTSRLEQVLSNSTLSRSLIESGLRQIRSRHTCAHRVDELLSLIN